ncbi:MAG: hypothetical protein ABEJ87_05940 [Candidatus Nanohalobium sp.]
MGRVDVDIPDRLDDITDDVLDSMDDAGNALDAHDEAWDKLERNLNRMNAKEIARLYAEEDIPYDAAKEWEEMVDLKYRMAGEEAFFDNMPDDQRPSEMYRLGAYEPSGILERIGHSITGRWYDD